MTLLLGLLGRAGTATF